MRNLEDFREVRRAIWVDPSRPIVATEPREEAWEIHLHAVDGATPFIARGEGELPAFEVEVVRSP